MWFDGVIEVDETVQLQLSVEVILEFGFHMPHLHQGADDPFGLAIGLRAVDLGELLADAVGFTGFGESVVVSALVFLAVVGIGVIDLVRALRQHVADEELGGAVLGLVGQDAGIKLAGKVVDGDEQVFPGLGWRLAFEQRQALGVKMDEFARIGLVVSLGLAFQAFLDGLLDLGQTLQTILDHLEALVGAVAGGKFLQPCPFQHLVEGRP